MRAASLRDRITVSQLRARRHVRETSSGKIRLVRLGDARELTLGSGGQACDDYPCLHRQPE